MKGVFMGYYCFDGTCFICCKCWYSFTRAQGVERTRIINGIMNWTVPVIPKCPRCGGAKVVLNLVDL